MKKIAILLIALTVAFSYSCKKEEGKEVKTSISGFLLTNGTSDKILMNNELDRPIVKLYEQQEYDAYDFKEIASVVVDENARYSFTLDLKKNNTYFIGFRNLDTTIYIPAPYSWSIPDKSYRFNYVTPGISNSINLYCLAKSWVRPRFINSNTDPNNNDVFDTKNDNIGPNQYSILLADINTVYQFLPLRGNVDSLAPWIHKTWSGTYKYGVKQPALTHKVEGKLTRNGVTTDVDIVYNAPPFDTTVVDIYY